MSIDINNYINTIMNFPKPGIAFKDISPILSSPIILSYVVDSFIENIGNDVDVIIGLDARGFIFGSLVAYKLQKPFVMVRKKGKLPGDVIEESYELEYGTNTQAIQVNSIKIGQKVAVVDDLLATGGTALCACNLIEKLGGVVQGCHFLVELKELYGAEKLNNYNITTLISYE